MGLIRALASATSSALGDQFKEFVTCPEVDNNVVVQRGIVNHGKGNPGASEGVISNGSAIVVPQGMAMMIIDNGKVVEFSAEAGTYTWDTSSEPSIFTGGLRQGILDTIKTIGNRFTYGGQTAKDQRVYYINVKVLPAVPFGSQQAETVYDPIYGSVEITYNGEFNIKVDDAVILVNTMLGANPKDTLTFDDIFASTGQNILKSKFAEKVSGVISDLMVSEGKSFREIQSYKSQVSEKMNDLLDEDWFKKYGIIVTEVAMRINASDESKEQIREIDKVRGMAKADAERVGIMSDAYSKNPNGAMAAATGEGILNASKNPNGAMGGFVGYGMAQNVGSNVMGAVSNMQPQGGAATGAVCPKCGAPVTGNFCSNCGTQIQ